MELNRRNVFQSYFLFICMFALGHLAALPKELRSSLYEQEYDYDETWEYDPEAAFMYYHYDRLDGGGAAPKSNDNNNDYAAEIDSYFTCVENGYYIHSDLLCDGFNDCPGGSDETDQLCGKIFSPPSNQETTTTTTPTTTTTVAYIDGDYDYEHCAPEEFQCTSMPGLCVSQSSLCDGVADCPGGEDEKLERCSRDNGVLEAKGSRTTTVDIVHPQLTILEPEFDIVHPEFDVRKTGGAADTLASTSVLKFATSGGRGKHSGGSTRMTKSSAGKHRNRNRMDENDAPKAPSPYKLLYRIFEQSPLKKKLKVLNRLQRLALQSDEMRQKDFLDLSELRGNSKFQETKQFQTLLKRMSRNASKLMNIKDLNINISIDIDDNNTDHSTDNIVSATPST